jgi:hypothetical protein
MEVEALFAIVRLIGGSIEIIAKARNLRSSPDKADKAPTKRVRPQERLDSLESRMTEFEQEMGHLEELMEKMASALTVLQAYEEWRSLSWFKRMFKPKPRFRVVDGCAIASDLATV